MKNRNCKVLQGGKCDITQEFTGTGEYQHRGIDLVGPGSTIINVVAYEAGQVLLAYTGYGNGYGNGVNWRYGNFVKILHDNGQVTLYAHLEYANVVVGQRVSKGQLLGRMGNSGNSRGVHLHWEIWKNNVYENAINPEPYLEDKSSFIPPKFVNRDINKRQFQVDYNDNLRVRSTPNGTILGVLNKGIYNFIKEQNSNGINWVEIQSGMWCGCTDMSRILEIEKPKEEPKEEPINNEIIQGYIDTINELSEQNKALDKEIQVLKDKLAMKDKELNNYTVIGPGVKDNFCVLLKENETFKYIRSEN